MPTTLYHKPVSPYSIIYYVLGRCGEIIARRGGEQGSNRFGRDQLETSWVTLQVGPDRLPVAGSKLVTVIGG